MVALLVALALVSPNSDSQKVLAAYLDECNVKAIAHVSTASLRRIYAASSKGGDKRAAAAYYLALRLGPRDEYLKAIANTELEPAGESIGPALGSLIEKYHSVLAFDLLLAARLDGASGEIACDAVGDLIKHHLTFCAHRIAFLANHNLSTAANSRKLENFQGAVALSDIRPRDISEAAAQKDKDVRFLKQAIQKIAKETKADDDEPGTP
ncbi:MAG: hypothetical protein JSS72_08730 [Armatimonadetes bacterium]|nr:hypothetical protein [Armatimonadota bacterium]